MSYVKEINVCLVIIGILVFGDVIPNQAQDLQRYTFDSRQMGAQFSIILYAEDKTAAARASRSAFERVEELNQMMSDYIDDSEVNLLSEKSGSGEWMKVSPELFFLLKTSLQISEKTGGLFDVTMGPLTHEWRFIRMMEDPELPAEEELKRLLRRTGYRHIELDKPTKSVRLKEENMQIDLGGIAKGYAAEEAIKTLQKSGIKSALVDAGGDITLSAPPPGQKNWSVAVPKGTASGKPGMISLQLNGLTVTTSGDMFQFVEIEGERYSHIINPKTGRGGTSRIQASVVSENSMYADAYASVLTLMDPVKGIELMNNLKNTEAVILEFTDDAVKEWTTEGFLKYLQ